MKTYVLSHFSALHWLLSHRDPRVGNIAPYLDVPASSDAPDSQVVEELRWTIGLEGPLDFLVIGDGALRRSSAVRPHRCSQDIPPGSLIPIACRAHGAEMLVCCPELAFLQICQAVDTLAAARSSPFYRSARRLIRWRRFILACASARTFGLIPLRWAASCSVRKVVTQSQAKTR